MPLHDETLQGLDLLPALLECGEDLSKYFDLDAAVLDEIINGEFISPEKRIERKDLDLLALSNVAAGYVQLKLSELCDRQLDSDDLWQEVSTYLRKKYLPTYSHTIEAETAWTQ